MSQKPKVTLEKLQHRGAECIALRFEKDLALNDVIKQIPGIRFSRTHRCWYASNDQSTLQSIFTALKAKAWLDDSGLKGVRREHAPGVSGKACPGEYIEQLDRMRYSENTKKVYVSFFRDFINHFPGTPVDAITDDGVNQYMRHLLEEKKISSSAQNQAINAIKFYYEKVRQGQRKIYALERPLKESKLPRILSGEEVAAILKAADNMKHRTMLQLIYAAGLRRSELINLKVSDIDSSRMVIHIRGAKGKKDRITILSAKILKLLREYFRQYRPGVWLFEGASGGQYSASSLHSVFTSALSKSGVRKEASLHTLRHSFATHMLESGTDIRYIQSLLGHNSSKTTEIYTHVTTRGLDKIRSPLDDLDL